MKNTTQPTTQRSSNFVKKFICDKCDYSCSKKGDFNKHLRSKKHNTTNTTAIQQQLSYTCECGKVYNHRASLYNHKKKCTHTEPVDEKEETTTSKDPLSEQPLFLQMIMQYFETLRKSEREERKSEQEQMGNMMKEIVKGNQELVKGNQETTKELVNKFIELAPKMGNTTNNNDNREITFNYYLENNCKDAEPCMAMMEKCEEMQTNYISDQ